MKVSVHVEETTDAKQSEKRVVVNSNPYGRIFFNESAGLYVQKIKYAKQSEMKNRVPKTIIEDDFLCDNVC